MDQHDSAPLAAVEATKATEAPTVRRGFLSKLLGSTELQWKQLFAKDGKTYRAPVLVLYRGATSNCGSPAESAMDRSIAPVDSLAPAALAPCIIDSEDVGCDDSSVRQQH